MSPGLPYLQADQTPRPPPACFAAGNEQVCRVALPSRVGTARFCGLDPVAETDYGAAGSWEKSDV